ncbi:MAG: hypothetical protein FJ387_25720 [Verrucomicrobia bacterium]|nr:hypothetical protein [Verrucomicrobiota bacterium]
MTTALNRIASRTCGVGYVATLMALLPFTGARAQITSFTGDGWINGVPVMGVFTTDGLGQVQLRGNVHTLAFQGSDPRVAGLDLVIMDMTYNADGTANGQGSAYLEVGTWDAGMTKFTPSGGVWVMNFSGRMQANGSVELHAAGYGVGGTIEGYRIAVTVSRGPVPDPSTNPFDPTVPFHRTGTIRPPPVNTTEVVETFDTPFTGIRTGRGQVSTGGGRLNVVGSFPNRTTTLFESYCWGLDFTPIWTVPKGMTREWRVNVVSLDENATHLIVANLAVGDPSAGAYAFQQSRNFAYLWKWVQGPNVLAVLAGDRTPVQNTDVVLALALTRVDPNVVITARVLDKADPNTVLYQRTVVDTPNVDPTLTADQFQALTGWRLENVAPETAGPPLTQFEVALGLAQYTDGAQPPPKAVFDNLEMRTSEIPPVGIERAVRLSWPASATINYSVEAAPTVQGPWLPVQDLAIPAIQQMTVPVTGPAQFFRLR